MREQQSSLTISALSLSLSFLIEKTLALLQCMQCSALLVLCTALLCFVVAFAATVAHPVSCAICCWNLLEFNVRCARQGQMLYVCYGQQLRSNGSAPSLASVSLLFSTAFDNVNAAAAKTTLHFASLAEYLIRIRFAIPQAIRPPFIVPSFGHFCI